METFRELGDRVEWTAGVIPVHEGGEEPGHGGNGGEVRWRAMLRSCLSPLGESPCGHAVEGEEGVSYCCWEWFKGVCLCPLFSQRISTQVEYAGSRLTRRPGGGNTRGRGGGGVCSAPRNITSSLLHLIQPQPCREAQDKTVMLIQRCSSSVQSLLLRPVQCRPQGYPEGCPIPYQPPTLAEVSVFHTHYSLRYPIPRSPPTSSPKERPAQTDDHAAER